LRIFPFLFSSIIAHPSTFISRPLLPTSHKI
jgi:hypothetical protein